MPEDNCVAGLKGIQIRSDVISRLQTHALISQLQLRVNSPQASPTPELTTSASFPETASGPRLSVPRQDFGSSKEMPFSVSTSRRPLRPVNPSQPLLPGFSATALPPALLNHIPSVSGALPGFASLKPDPSPFSSTQTQRLPSKM